MMRVFSTVVLAFTLSTSVQGATPRAELSPRNANYRIEVTLDHEQRTLHGRLELDWRNIQQREANELRFHLYWNAWRNNRSTWLREDRFRGRSDHDGEVEEDAWSFINIESMSLVGPGAAHSLDLTPGIRYLWPDDENAEDRTLVGVDLPEPVAPGESVRVEIEWIAKIPRTFARTGFRGDYYFLAHWFPKLAVFESDGWSSHQYHSATEYYSDYGIYDVTMRVPTGWLVGATGREVEVLENGDGTTSHRYLQEDVHAFTWTTSPDYVVLEDVFDVPDLPEVALRLLMQPEHLGQAERHFTAAKAALEHYGRWYGPYPYAQMTFVDPAWGSGAGGMEYPTLFTCGTRLFNPAGGGRPEGVTIHEAGHQFWYGIVGNNEFEHAWIDEGLNSFSDARVMDVAYDEWFYTKRYFTPPGTEAGRGFFPLLFRDIRKTREVDGNGLDRYRQTARSDIPTTPTWQYHPGTASGISYSKTAVWLHTLERYLGWDTLQPVLSEFFVRYAFAHPRPEDFFAVASEVAGEDLGWFFEQVMNSAVTFDYAIDSAKSIEDETKGLIGEGRPVPVEATPGDDEQDEESIYETTVVVRRLGAGVFPVDVLLVFEDGSEVRERWDGAARWKLFSHRGSAKLDHAVVDPDRVLLLDLDYTNNSRLREEGSRWPAIKWASKWLVWMQELLSAVAFFA